MDHGGAIADESDSKALGQSMDDLVKEKAIESLVEKVIAKRLQQWEDDTEGKRQKTQEPADKPKVQDRDQKPAPAQSSGQPHPGGKGGNVARPKRHRPGSRQRRFMRDLKAVQASKVTSPPPIAPVVEPCGGGNPGTSLPFGGGNQFGMVHRGTLPISVGHPPLQMSAQTTGVGLPLGLPLGGGGSVVGDRSITGVVSGLATPRTPSWAVLGGLGPIWPDTRAVSFRTPLLCPPYRACGPDRGAQVRHEPKPMPCLAARPAPFQDTRPPCLGDF